MINFTLCLIKTKQSLWNADKSVDKSNCSNGFFSHRFRSNEVEARKKSSSLRVHVVHCGAMMDRKKEDGRHVTEFYAVEYSELQFYQWMTKTISITSSDAIGRNSAQHRIIRIKDFYCWIPRQSGVLLCVIAVSELTYWFFPNCGFFALVEFFRQLSVLEMYGKHMRRAQWDLHICILFINYVHKLRKRQ